MTTILDDEQDDGQKYQIDLNNNQSDLLMGWVAEQTSKIRVIQNQLNQINGLSADKLDSLCDYLEDIDYHTSGLNNILSMVVGIPETENRDEFSGELTNTNILDEEIYDDRNNSSLLPKKWSLLHALWFHMIMKTDPESIYYSPRIGRDAWPYEFIPTS